MRRFVLALLFAAMLVIAPPVLDKLDVGGTYVLTPLIPGILVGAVLERADLIRGMDDSGDLTKAAAITMYLGSFFAWLAAAWLSACLMRRRVVAVSANSRLQRTSARRDV